jgi:hypothetical protein
VSEIWAEFMVAEVTLAANGAAVQQFRPIRVMLALTE